MFLKILGHYKVKALAFKISYDIQLKIKNSFLAHFWTCKRN